MTRSRSLIGLCFALALLAFAGRPARGALIFDTIALGSGTFDRVGGVDTVTDGAEITINAFGAVSFVGRTTTPAVTTNGVYTGAGGALTTVTTEETRKVGGNVVRKEVYAPAINAAGVLAWTRYGAGEAVPVTIQYGASAPFSVASSNGFSNVGNAAIDDNGAVYFFGSGSGFHGIYQLPTTTNVYNKIARSGQPYNSVRAPYSVSRNGNVAFRAFSGSNPEVEALYAYVAGTTSTVADDQGLFLTFDDGPTINSNGDYAFVGELRVADPTTGATRALYFKPAGGAVTLVVPESDAGKHRLRALSMRNDGAIAFNAIDGSKEALFLRHPDGTIERVIGSGDKLAGKTIGYVYNSRYGLNEAGHIAFLVYFTDFTYGVFRARAAGPGDVPHAMSDTVNIRGTTKLDVLANDTPATVTGATLKITAVTAPAKGRAIIAAGKSITYIPNTKFDGTDTFTYTVTSNGFTDTATVTVTNPFYALRGSFFQIVTANGVPVGTLTAKLSTAGVVSGTLLVNGKSYLLNGTAAFDGSFTQTFKRRIPANTPDLVVNLNFAVNNSAAEVSGGATGDAAPYAFAATAVALTALPAGIEAGAYTVLLPPDANPINPRGTGYATATLSKTGSLRLAGKLGDGTILSAGGQLDARSAARVYVPLYVKPKGLLFGTLTFATVPSRFSGTLTWNKPQPAVATGLFPSGFSATTAVDGSRYTAVRNVRTLFYTAMDAKGDFHVRDGGLAAIDATVSVTIADKVTADLPNPNKVLATISRTAGLFSGSFVPTGTTKAIKFYGVVHQGENQAAGYFLGTAQSGTVELVPK
ncbi:MAG TPA: Ig-like domain-containing protein [Chthoniobacteraceae bacterium]|jgi:hypothetical protein|nr:Ig-like domain-containing protein [Chthoniobacteraceae bacterium]